MSMKLILENFRKGIEEMGPGYKEKPVHIDWDERTPPPVGTILQSGTHQYEVIEVDPHQSRYIKVRGLETGRVTHLKQGEFEVVEATDEERMREAAGDEYTVLDKIKFKLGQLLGKMGSDPRAREWATKLDDILLLLQTVTEGEAVGDPSPGIGLGNLWNDLNTLLKEWTDTEHQYYKDLHNLMEDYSTSPDRPTRLPSKGS